ncbi:MAG: transposase [Tannerellaceae bacterium]|nr:transposase [Tannerellaceae bacterium]
MNDRREILDFVITRANTDDRESLKNKRFHDKLFGKILPTVDIFPKACSRCCL